MSRCACVTGLTQQQNPAQDCRAPDELPDGFSAWQQLWWVSRPALEAHWYQDLQVLPVGSVVALEHTVGTAEPSAVDVDLPHYSLSNKIGMLGAFHDCAHKLMSCRSHGFDKELMTIATRSTHTVQYGSSNCSNTNPMRDEATAILCIAIWSKCTMDCRLLLTTHQGCC